MLGIITTDDVLDVATEEATEDMHKMGATGALEEPYLHVGFLAMIRKRAGWLSVLFLGEMLTASVMSSFEDQIARAVVLAMFIPLIISSGGNSGSQTATLIVRSLALGELRTRDWMRACSCANSPQNNARGLAWCDWLSACRGVAIVAPIRLWATLSARSARWSASALWAW